jgi:hypothetical protein
MTFKTILPLLATATTLVAASGAMAANQSSPPATANDVQIQGAYAYLDNFAGAKQPYVVVVFKTGGALERRFDGLVRAGAKLDGVGASIGSVRGKRGRAVNHCYTITIKTKDGRIYGGHKINVGSRHTLALTAKDADGNEIADSTKLTIKKRKVGDRSGKPLSC